jgi:hypothetical protein
MQDEVFYVQLSNPSANATIAKGRGAITLIDDDRSQPGVQFLTAVSGGNISIGATKLQWRIPGAQNAVTDVFVAWKTGPTCSFPTSTTDTAGGGGMAVGSAAGAGQLQIWPHPSPPPNTTFCYSVFALYPGPTAEIARVKTRTFDATGTVAWLYASGSGTGSVVPPTIGQDAIYTTDNVGILHALTRGTTGGGLWPGGWNPVALGKPTQNRSAVVPVPGASPRLLLGTDGGGVHSVDARFGNVIWSRSSNFGSALPSSGGVQAQPAALLKQFGGNNDMVLVGTNFTTPNNRFYALDLQTGADQGLPYSHAQMGSVNGMAVVDYASNRVFFLTTSGPATLFGLDMGPVGTPSLTLATVAGGNPGNFGGSNGAITIRNNRLVFGDTAGNVVSLNLGTGLSYNTTTSDGEVKGFVWPDRRDDRLYFATVNNVNAMRDTGAALNPIWSIPVTTPSMVLQKPGSDFVYVGDGNGRLIQINVNTQATVPLTLEGAGVQIGAPSLDNVHNLVIVGTLTGNVYAVRVPY